MLNRLLLGNWSRVPIGGIELDFGDRINLQSRICSSRPENSSPRRERRDGRS